MVTRRAARRPRPTSTTRPKNDVKKTLPSTARRSRCSARARSATCSSSTKRQRIPRRQGDHARRSPEASRHAKRSRTARRCSVAADPRARRTGAGSQGRNAASPQPGGAVRGLARRPRAGCRAQRAGQQRPVRGRPVRPDPVRSASGDLPDRSGAAGVRIRLLATPTSAPSSSSTPPPTTRSRCSRTARANRSPTNHENAGEQLRTTSGLFCAYNKGTTTVSIRAGGLSYTLPVTVQAGSVREPCGTVPLKRTARASQTQTSRRPRRRPRPRPPGPRRAPRRRRCRCRPPPLAPRARGAGPRRAGAAARSSSRWPPRHAAARVRAAARCPRRRGRRRRRDLGRDLAGRGGRTRRGGGGGAPSRSPIRRSPTAPPNTSPRPCTCSGSCCWPRSPAPQRCAGAPSRSARAARSAGDALDGARAAADGAEGNASADEPRLVHLRFTGSQHDHLW